MTTVLYLPERFAACDSCWSSDGRAVLNVREDKYLFFTSRSDSKMYIVFMSGDHIAIVISQAMYLQIITFEEYADIIGRCMTLFDLEYEYAIFELKNGILKTPPTSYYPQAKKGGAFWMGSGGLAASKYFYYCNRIVRKKRRKYPSYHLADQCRIAGALKFACSHDRLSGGKVHKIEWLQGSCIGSSILPIPNNYRDTYAQNLLLTMGEINEMINTKTLENVVASKKHSANQKSSDLKHDTMAQIHADIPQTKMTMSRALEQFRLFDSL